MVLRQADDFSYPVNEFSATILSKLVSSILKLDKTPLSLCRIIERRISRVPDCSGLDHCSEGFRSAVMIHQLVFCRLIEAILNHLELNPIFAVEIQSPPVNCGALSALPIFMKASACCDALVQTLIGALVLKFKLQLQHQLGPISPSLPH